MQTNKKNQDKEKNQKDKEYKEKQQQIKDRINDCKVKQRQWTKGVVHKQHQKEESTMKLMVLLNIYWKREKEEMNQMKKQKKEEEIQKVTRNNLERQLQDLQKSIIYETAKNKSLYQTQEYKHSHQKNTQKALYILIDIKQSITITG